jgi:V/A-type H+-transporting ATPase subunit E
MSKQDIIDRIISDAEGEAKDIIADAQGVADRILAQSAADAEKEMNVLKEQTSLKAQSIIAGKQASARLEGAKILLAEKRRVIDEVYAKALQQLKNMSPSDYLKMTEKLLISYADEGDEIMFADGFPCVKEVSSLAVVKDKKLKISFGNSGIDGGFVLCGKDCDKDLSFSALLAADRENNEAEIAAQIFK